MEDLKLIIANHITELRKSEKLTQAELAARLNYSDKAISKWERGESLPDIGVLKQIADMFGVTVDYLLHEDASRDQEQYRLPREKRANRVTITALAISVVWIIATAVYVYTILYTQVERVWIAFVWAVPVSCLVALYFNRIWGSRHIKFWILSVFTWSMLAASVIQTIEYVTWPLLTIGIPVQIALVLWSRIEIEPGESWLPRRR